MCNANAPFIALSRGISPASRETGGGIDKNISALILLFTVFTTSSTAPPSNHFTCLELSRVAGLITTGERDRERKKEIEQKRHASVDFSLLTLIHVFPVLHLVKLGLSVVVGILEVGLEPAVGNIHHDRVQSALDGPRDELRARGRAT